MKSFDRRVLFSIQLLAILVAPPCKAQSPNLVVILADDMGWNDISLHGSKTPTPHIDRLAKSGVAFQNLVVNSVCSPTRASFYTGCDAVRNGFGGEVGDRMNPSFTTIAQTFKAAGYQTGVFGKWHNGKSGAKDPWAITPVKAGFDSFKGFYGGGTDYYSQVAKNKGPRNWHINDAQSEAQQGYLTDLISDSAIQFIKQNSEKPFFCMVTQAAPHEPFQATDKLLARVPERIRGGIKLTENAVREKTAEFSRSGEMNEETWEYGGFTEAERRVVYSAMMIGLDDSVGEILKTLEATGKDKNTIVLLLSDNGAMRFIREGNLPLRECKHSLYDGGIRVPGFLSFPKGGVKAGGSYEPMIRGVDLFPTLAALAKVSIAEPKVLDGVNHLPAILGKAKASETEWNGIFVYYGGYRDNEWKLIAKAGSSELYDLKQDPSELNDVTAKFPEVTRRLRAKHDSWLEKHGANVNYTPPTAKGSSEAQPAGEVLDLHLAASKKPTTVNLLFPFGSPSQMKASGLKSENVVCTPGDCLVYDMKIERMLPGQTAFISPMRGSPIFGGSRGTGIDSSGVRVASTKELPGPMNEWKRYVLGLGNSAASSLSDFSLIIESKVQGDVHVLIDNVVIQKPNGLLIPVWTGGKAPQGGSALTCKTVKLEGERP